MIRPPIVRADREGRWREFSLYAAGNGDLVERVRVFPAEFRITPTLNDWLRENTTDKYRIRSVAFGISLWFLSERDATLFILFFG